MCGGFACRVSVVSGKPALPTGCAWFQLWPVQLYGKSRNVGLCPRASAVAHRCSGPAGLRADAEPVGVVGQFAGRHRPRQRGIDAALERAVSLSGNLSISLAAGRLASSGPESFCGCLRCIDTGVTGPIGGAIAAGSHPRSTTTGATLRRPAEQSPGLGADVGLRAVVWAATECL